MWKKSISFSSMEDCYAQESSPLFLLSAVVVLFLANSLSRCYRFSITDNISIAPHSANSGLGNTNCFHSVRDIKPTIMLPCVQFYFPQFQLWSSQRRYEDEPDKARKRERQRKIFNIEAARYCLLMFKMFYDSIVPPHHPPLFLFQEHCERV